MRRLGVVLLIVVLLAVAWAPAALAVPPIPHLFSGTVTVNGEPVTEGASIAAWADASLLATSPAVIDSSGSGDVLYALAVPGDDSETAGVQEGAYPGATIRFYIGAPYLVWADQEGVWQSGGITTLHLTASKVTPDPVRPRAYCPIVHVLQ